MVVSKKVVVLLAVALTVFTIGAAYAQQSAETQTVTGTSQTITVVDLPSLFEEKTGTITITTEGINLDPDVPGPGPIAFTARNQTDIPRGVVLTSTDRADNPIIRYSRKIAPGESVLVRFWVYPDKDFTVRDYTSRQIVRGESIWASTFSTSFEGPVAPTTTIALAPPIVIP